MSPKTYKIGQVAQMLGLKTFVLRFWESEFPQIAPLRTPSGQRLYSEKQIKLIENIRQLLHSEGLTIEGAKRRLSERERDNRLLNDMQADLLEIKKLLNSQ